MKLFKMCYLGSRRSVIGRNLLIDGDKWNIDIWSKEHMDNHPDLTNSLIIYPDHTNSTYSEWIQEPVILGTTK